MNLDLSCPQCDHDDWVQRVPAIMSEATLSGHSTSIHSGVGLAPNGLVPVVGVSSHEVTLSSALARSLAWQPALPVPGRRALPILILLFFFGCAFAMGCAGAAEDPPDGDPVQILVSVVGLFFIPILLAIPLVTVSIEGIKRARRASKVAAGRPRALKVWSHACYCHRCGVAFWPYPTEPGIPCRVPLPAGEFRWYVWNAGGYATL
ncbi:hypothetical protein [Nocardia asteroides]|uniref:hypothetical protein n=1 Tax=Nocardia asteroides TaxID=1824 RepID=UPI003424BE47